MKVGIDSFSLHPLKLDPFGELEWTASHGFAGIQFGGIHGLAGDNDPGRLREIRTHADGLDLYTQVSVGGCNPVVTGESEEELVRAVGRRVALAAQFEWHELHGVLGGHDDRFNPKISWPRQLEASARVLTRLAPALQDLGSRINLETHGDVTTFELVRLVDRVGPEVLGICLDTANVLLHGEHPLLAARRVGPYTHLTHCKDAIVYLVGNGLRRQTLPCGTGHIDWPALVEELRAHQPDLALNIEDHKWLFDAPIFERRWQELHPDVGRDEVLELVKSAWQCQQQITRGDLQPPEASEAIPYSDELEPRLRSAFQHLSALQHLKAAVG
jgi:sugar phosphate isomerase/epimerase